MEETAVTLAPGAPEGSGNPCEPEGDPRVPESVEKHPTVHELERLGDELAAHLHAVTYRLLVRLRAFDRCFAEAGGGMGFRSAAEWLSWRTGIGPGAAREKLARGAGPGAAAAAQPGHGAGPDLVFEGPRVNEVATSENERDLLEIALSATAAHIERIGRAWRRVDRLEAHEEENARHERRTLTLFPDSDGMYVIHGRLAPEVGAAVEQALRAAGDALRRADDHARGGEVSAAQSRADAIGLVAEWALGGGAAEPCAGDENVEKGETAETGENTGNAAVAENGTGDNETTEDSAVDNASGDKADNAASHPRAPGRTDRYQVLVHVDADALREGSDTGRAVLSGLRSDIHVSAETSRRIACDAGRVEIVHNANGEILSVGRRTRMVPTPIRRALEARDRSCRFPGCAVRYCDAHHVRHWADHGETRLANLVLLCRRHHRAVHEEGFGVDIDEGGEVRFRWPDGRPFPDAPRPSRLPADPVAAVKHKHNSAGLGIDAGTTTPAWHGEPLDLDYAMTALRAG